MKKEHAPRLAALSSAFGMGIALMVGAPAVLAQQAQPAPNAASAQVPAAVPPPAQGAIQDTAPDTAEMVEAEELVYEPLQVGDATQGLLAWQRSGEIASPTPRPIAGNVANRSYERYLKSFEFPIPERMSSSVKSSSGSGTTAAK
ncbi:DUF3613 domain-containing protein [Variovorax sp. ZS18.2.2]|uniref:DUF3613 domain-containing protein n=1 Tax=Variovorax sp. ZS18.2.2 TaxID=2971255 RepID=UPI002150D491|nr:DUF3613 domain-containing protein [Variovorax sp. ZS18.2.2]MCR6479714.1 DUF3613 domain-containing protein [Variovorax sp. ZS18.2.2]